ncbi:MAG: anthranilate phosphoribosyltransferase [Candidatus Glassbacteria bacterium]
MIREAIAKIADGKDLSREEAIRVMEEIATGAAKPQLITALLASLRTKGETVDEITGFATVMRRHAIHISPTRSDLVDTCGTGGDGANTFNISTAASFVIAGAGVGVAKHGNRAVSSSCGSADLLESLGVEIVLGEKEVARCIDEVGIGFLFAQRLHPAMKHAAGPRKELGMRTVFNMLGPLTNPASVKRQLLGTFDGRLALKLIKVMAELGAERALVVHSDDGLDEISISGRTSGYYFDGERIMRILMTPEEYGVRSAPLEAIKARSLEESRNVFLSVLNGSNGPAKDVVLLNAGAGLFVAGLSASIGEGVERARESIDSGKALESFEGLKAISRELGSGQKRG